VSLIKISKSTSKKKKKRKKGEHAGLSNVKVFATLSQLLAEENAKLTMLGLAKKLGVYPAALRARYPDGLDQILAGLVLDRIERAVPPVEHGKTPEEYLRNLLVSVVGAFEEPRRIGRYIGPA